MKNEGEVLDQAEARGGKNLSTWKLMSGKKQVPCMREHCLALKDTNSQRPVASTPQFCAPKKTPEPKLPLNPPNFEKHSSQQKTTTPSSPQIQKRTFSRKKVAPINMRKGGEKSREKVGGAGLFPNPCGKPKQVLVLYKKKKKGFSPTKFRITII